MSLGRTPLSITYHLENSGRVPGESVVQREVCEENGGKITRKVTRSVPNSAGADHSKRISPLISILDKLGLNLYKLLRNR